MTTASDDFNRANETPIASPWTSAVGSGANLTSNALTSTASTDKQSFYSGTWGNDQECTATVGNLASNSRYAQLNLRLNATSGGNGFSVYTDGASGSGHTEFAAYTNGSQSVLGTIATTFANGDTMRFTVSGSSPNIVLTCYKNGTQVGQVTGQSGNNSGNPGAGAFGAATIDGWSATDNAAGGTSITSGLGQLTITGLAPTVSATANVSLSSGLGQLTITGYAPTVSASGAVSIASGLGQLTITGYAPTVSATGNVAITVGLGQLTVTGYDVTQDLTLPAPGTGALVLTGYAPTVVAGANSSISSGLGALTLTGYAPTVAATANVWINPDTGAVVITGYSPGVDTGSSASISPDVGLLILQGYPPDVSVPSRNVGAGRSKKRRRVEIEVDGEVFDVASEADAVYLLEKLKETAQEKADSVVSKSSTAGNKLPRKVIHDARKALKAPVIKAPADLAFVVDDIARIYEEALEAVEKAVLRKKQEDDEDDAIIQLIL